MNKKGDSTAIKVVIEFIIIAIVAFAVVFGFFYPKFKESGLQVTNIQNAIKPDTNIFGTKSFSLEEKERCAKLANNPAVCMGNEKSKTGCFWGKTTSGVGCYSCKNNKFFGDAHGKCSDYYSIFYNQGNLLTDDNGIGYGIVISSSTTENIEIDRLICTNNPCDFSAKSKCSFSHVKEYTESVGELGNTDPKEKFEEIKIGEAIFCN